MAVALCSRVRSWLLLLVVLGAQPARAIDEIQVYNGEINRPGEWSLEQHLNYGFRARRPDYPGALINSRAFNGTPELAVGATPWLEFGAYAPFAIRQDRLFLGGGKLRALLTIPGAAERGWLVGLNTELSWQSPRFSRSRWNLELRPIIGMRRGQWEVIFNPIVDLGLGGRQGNSFVPATRVAYEVRPGWQLGIETYSDLGPLGGFVLARRQAHQVFAVTDFQFRGLDINLGVGRGLTAVSDRWVGKIIFGRGF
ncbi:MAG: hypothetical protein H7345_20285 [Rubritepida sp.]|nr:hypothetical protein [Rubritepida sp.]